LTEHLLQRLRDNDIQTEFVTLHVGTGTFRPIKVDDVSQHQMHSELGILTAETAAKISETKADGGRVIAVGTTSVRILETVAQQGEIKAWTGATDIYIYPGHKFNMVDGLMTNFHLPRTSLLVLVRTFGGDKLIRDAYAEAVENDYRFFSYGDAMLIV
jgi:S-adenosylmethionine:tRNA ribosyltransferase-isomerase